MKFSKCFILAGAAALLAACSSEEPIVGPGADQPDLSDVETYAQFTISMVGDNGTRAAGFKNGDPEEYAVKSGKMLVFGLPKDGDHSTVAGRVQAKYIIATDLEFTPDATGEDDQYDATALNVKTKFKKGTFSTSSYEKFYGVVILNPTNDWLPAGGQTFKDWAENKTLGGDLYDEDGYMVMTNAALYNRAGNTSVLSEINTNNVKDTEIEVVADAATFTVQRIAAKVSLANFGAKGTKVFTIKEGTYNGGSATINGWDMDLTRKTAYPVQNVWGDNVTEFFEPGASPWFHSGIPERCHWADSKFYNTTMTVADCKANFTFIGATPVLNTVDEHKYIRPNTLAFNKMSKGQTTRMIIGAKFAAKGVAANTTLYKFKNIETLYTAATLKVAVENICKNDLTDKITSPVVTINEGSKGGWRMLDGVVTVTGITDKQKEELGAALGIYDQTKPEIAVFFKGQCYYPVYIRHFADEQEAANIKVTPGVSLGIYEKKHTGRYGIQRNTWYEVTVTSIKGPGLPSVPDPDPTKPVDEIEEDSYRYMQVDCNILNWAKRSQNVEL